MVAMVAQDIRLLGDWGADYPYGQTSPPSRPVVELFLDGDYPTGEVVDYHQDLYVGPQ
jgi:hypothetical protein